VLAGAAEQLFAGYLLKHGDEPAFSSSRVASVDLANAILAAHGLETNEKRMGDAMNRAYNHSKHAGSTDHTVRMDSRAEARDVIDRAISNFDGCAALGYRVPVIELAQRFMTEGVGVQSNEARPESR
jgi:hypothetical protein